MNILENVSLYGENVDIEFDGEKIVSVKKSVSGKKSDYRVYPGLFDIHSHGMMGMDTCDDGSVEKMAPVMLSHGVVSWCPTTMTIDIEQVRKITSIKPEVENGCEIIGYHLEGPYINEKYKGAQNPEYIRKASVEELKTIENVSTITVAPETEGCLDFIKNVDIPVCLGHTDCDYDTAIKAIENGANCLTHTFNAMPPIHHRNPGPIGAASEKGIYAQVICDGVHIHKAAVLMLYKLFGPGRLILISDSVRPAGLSDGEYELGGLMTYVKNGEARLASGNLAGSTTFLFDMVKKAIEFGIPEKEAFQMASENPYRMMGIQNRGRIEAGFSADFILTDKDMNIVSVVKKGKRFDY